MAKKKKQGHWCYRCQMYRANEKFSDKGHARHLCKECNKDLKQVKRLRKHANKKALAAGLRPLKKAYPKTAQQVAGYLQITLKDFEMLQAQLQLEACAVTENLHDPMPLYDIDAIITVSDFIKNRDE